MYGRIDAAVVRASVWRPDHHIGPWPDLIGPHATAPAWRAWLRQAAQAPGFLDAIEVAAPHLADQIRLLSTDRPAPERTVRRTLISVLRYLLRARTRATPFGLFAGVGPARFGNAPLLRTGIDNRPVPRPDSAWVDKLVGALHEHEGLRAGLVLLASDLAVERDGHLVVEHVPRSTSEATYAHISVRATPPVQGALAAARSPILWADLRAKLSTDFPDVPEQRIDTLLAGLVQQHLLLTSLQPAATAPDPLDEILAALEKADAAEAPDLREVTSALRNHQPARAKDAMARLLPSAAPTLAVDLHLNWDLVIPDAVAAEAAEAAAALVRSGPRPALSSGWMAWHHRFLDRYGPGAVVPLHDVLDALGYPSGYLGSTAAPTGTTVTDRDKLLLRIAHDAAVRRRREVPLDDATLSLLGNVPAGTPIQPSTELTVRIDSSSLLALGRGEFTLHVTGVAREAGTMTGRFLPLLEEKDRARMMTAYAELPAIHKNALHAQISTASLGRAANVARVPQAAHLLLSLGEFHEGGPGRLPLADVAVTADANRLHLVSLTHQRPVHTRLLHAVDLAHHTHPLARFLFEAPVALAAPCTGFSWGPAASALPFLPALRYGRTVLSPARWTLDATSLPNARARWPQWANALATWQQSVNLPERVHLGQGDQGIGLDLTEPTHQALLRAHLDRHGTATLRPAPEQAAMKWMGGRAHEIVLPLASTTTPLPPVRWPGRVAPRAHGHLPGNGTWLHLKLYGHPDRQSTLLTRHLAPNLGDLKVRWWFVRYRKPEDHLRVRLAVPPHRVGPLMEAVGAWTRRLQENGLITGTTWDTYYPETDRFGGPAAMDAAERFFVADSRAVVAQLAAQEGTNTIDAQAMTAASMVDIATGLLGERTQALHWIVANTRTGPTPPPRTVHDQAVALVAAGPSSSLLGAHIPARWEARREALADYRRALEQAGTLQPSAVLPDLLHLHQARTDGPDHAQEATHLHLARAAALSRIARETRKP
ncbi:lantibiotic dehydratase [Streptomyces sp. NPDC087440]|uniref:lantibiotic dehydratase n=1 Tax=Streptomyces sp. NPDC087440 TaxID=3365790 RepID=UPI003809A5EE